MTDKTTDRDKLAIIARNIRRFDKECGELEHTDTGDVWDLFDLLLQIAASGERCKGYE